MREYDHMADWQPISDGLLPSPGQYFITWEGKINEAGHVYRFIEIAEYCKSPDGDESLNYWDLSHIEERNYLDIKVIAWMDLPEKYSGDELNCTDCILDGTDACSRSAGRAVDDEVCDDFLTESEEV